MQSARAVARIKYSNDKLLSVYRGRQTHAVINTPPFDGHREVAILDLILLTCLDLAQDFYDPEESLKDLF